ncbi:hypothetical protein ACTFIV_011324, partial [Dictyostelium citrinum]
NKSNRANVSGNITCITINKFNRRTKINSNKISIYITTRK